MRAIVLDRQGLRFVADHPQPWPAAHDVLVRVILAGICETDLQLACG